MKEKLRWLAKLTPLLPFRFLSLLSVALVASKWFVFYLFFSFLLRHCPSLDLLFLCSLAIAGMVFLT
ncbi:hypothetical protein HanXRQr2_Chr02g0059791 [Helianthus annuus]|uniref:Uncharacterized protein n=1 Tax=Helianthus annuus TaxID=4232 RepID=A0A251VDZ2_HELAN|nr:hypothetical protein HanXRQr2_Chr02g0059791 [Helianthus annuus]KAJ0951344.1 hypothetical protein HanPSC8_Chr02g0058871 [Helianthus annuus]